MEVHRLNLILYRVPVASALRFGPYLKKITIRIISFHKYPYLRWTFLVNTEPGIHLKRHEQFVVSNQHYLCFMVMKQL